MDKNRLKYLPKRYKNKGLNGIYWSYISIEEPDKVGCGGNMDCHFIRAYKGLDVKFVKTSLLQPAVMAGREWRKNHKKYFPSIDKIYEKAFERYISPLRYERMIKEGWNFIDFGFDTSKDKDEEKIKQLLEKGKKVICGYMTTSVREYYTRYIIYKNIL